MSCVAVTKAKYFLSTAETSCLRERLPEGPILLAGGSPQMNQDAIVSLYDFRIVSEQKWPEENSLNQEESRELAPIFTPVAPLSSSKCYN